MNKRNSGITLVALVITIIVLLILAGVSIALVVGDNGILSKSQEAKAGSIVAEEREQVDLAYSSALTKNLGNAVTAENLQDELDLSVGANETTVTVDGNSLKVLFNETGHSYDINNGKEPITLDKLLEFINNNEVCWNSQTREFTEKLKFLGYYYGSTESNNIEWEEARVYRCSIDNNIYIVGNRTGSEQIEMEQVNWDGTTTLDNDGLPVTLYTQIGTYQRGSETGIGEFSLATLYNGEDWSVVHFVFVCPTFNELLILKYYTDGVLGDVEWKD